eukprot:439491-Hanusia_phi.AAC.1
MLTVTVSLGLLGMSIAVSSCVSFRVTFSTVPPDYRTFYSTWRANSRLGVGTSIKFSDPRRATATAHSGPLLGM